MHPLSKSATINPLGILKWKERHAGKSTCPSSHSSSSASVFQLDRMNLASALTGGFMKAIHVNQSTINVGNQLMFLGIVVLEIPSNMLLQRIGLRKWIAAQVFIFGVIAILQGLIKNRAGFLATRMFLGLAEAGYSPASIYTLST
ncbi:hypothetical protein MAP00_005522 [Monascus purpureus]|nr:hypothetical protein MAP00_005522 [Monascus purpureus]